MILVDDEVSDFGALTDDSIVFFQLLPVFKDYHFTLGMISNVFASLWTVGRINPDGNVPGEYRTIKRDKPLYAVVSEDHHWSIFCNSMSDKSPSKAADLSVIFFEV